MKRKILFTSFVLLFFFVLGMALKARAGSAENVIGWLWGGSEDGNSNGAATGVGFISMNSSDCDVDGNGFLDVMCGGNNVDTAIVNYGVNIPMIDGDLSGYAWSSNLGWISFNSSDISGCPDSVCVSRRVGNRLVGWARALDIKAEYEKVPSNSGGWQGFIKLDTVNPITINPVTSELSGYGWNGEDAGSGSNVANGLGWISFVGAKISVPKTLNATLSANPNAGKSPLTSSLTVAIDPASTATGDVTYKLDCQNDGGVPDAVYGPSPDLSHEFNNACVYTALGLQSFTASVEVTRGGITTKPLATIILNLCSCDDTGDYCDGQGYVNSCGADCVGSKKCAGSGNWIEVAP